MRDSKVPLSLFATDFSKFSSSISFSDFYAKGSEKTESLRQLLQRNIILLETLFFSKKNELEFISGDTSM